MLPLVFVAFLLRSPTNLLDDTMEINKKILPMKIQF